MEIQLGTARSTDSRCVYCHDRVGGAWAGVRCLDCGVRLHVDCRLELVGCPTLGCTGVVGTTSISRAARERSRTHVSADEASRSEWTALGFERGAYVGAVVGLVAGAVGLLGAGVELEQVVLLLLPTGWGIAAGMLLGAVTGWSAGGIAQLFRRGVK